MLLVVGGHSRKIGKSSVVEGIIRSLPEAGWTAVKMTRRRGGGESRDWTLQEETSATDTDSGRYLRAGARRSYWISAADGADSRDPARAHGDPRRQPQRDHRIKQCPGPPPVPICSYWWLTRRSTTGRRPQNGTKTSPTYTSWCAAGAGSHQSGRRQAGQQEFPVRPPDYVTDELVNYLASRLNRTTAPRSRTQTSE